VVGGYCDEDFVELLEKTLGLGDVAVGKPHVDDHEGHGEVGKPQLKIPVFFQQNSRKDKQQDPHKAEERLQQSLITFPLVRKLLIQRPKFLAVTYKMELFAVFLQKVEHEDRENNECQ